MSSNFNFHGPVSGEIQMGDHNVQHNTVYNSGTSTAEALRLATDLVRELGPSAPPEAEAVRAELARAEAGNEPPDHGRIRAWLNTVSLGVGTGSSALVLSEGIMRALGG
ncbi:hypothetical protein OG548_06220 [Streptomyces sp. NBC_01356]|uniref:hypothetical protein n=1 Tax=Streptomyces sp. NBC_01356 TaxID=2903836 RepID=UPI002E32903E|nr:hypothetical protein [Streptomyces sp. NBC_01356]